MINNIVFSGSKDNIAMTMIDGKILYADRNFYLKENIEDIYRECQEASERIEEKFQKVIKDGNK